MPSIYVQRGGTHYKFPPLGPKTSSTYLSLDLFKTLAQHIDVWRAVSEKVVRSVCALLLFNAYISQKLDLYDACLHARSDTQNVKMHICAD